MAQNARKRTQRERLLNGMIQVANRSGYAGASVSAVIAQAGVSRPTFYDYFGDRDDCFHACIADVQQELLGAVELALEHGRGDGAATAAVRALVAYAVAEPARARFLTAEPMAGGEDALDLRDRGITQIADAIEAAQRRVPATGLAVDVDARVLVGAVQRLLATRLRRGEPAISKLAQELIGWLAAYERPVGECRWQRLQPGPVPARSPHLPDAPIQQMPAVLGPGRPRLSEAEIAENHRQRIMYATAQLAVQKGYTATTVADITRLASVDGRAFYRHFADKQDAFAAVHEFGFQHVMDVTAKAFFAAEGWPQRSWEADRALTQLLAENPLIAHVGFVEAYAVGTRAVQRIEDSHTAFTFFLQEGLMQRPQTQPPSRVAMEAIIDAIFEVIYLQTRRGQDGQIAAMPAPIAHLWLTPFIGVKQAEAFIERQLVLRRNRRRNAAAT